MCRFWRSPYGEKDAPSALELERVARSLEIDLKQVKGTREVQTIGGPGRAVQVNLNPTRMRERGLDMLSVRAALAGANAGMPSGFVMNPNSKNGQRISIETGYFFESAKDVADVVVGVHAGKPIYLKEVAQIEEGAQQAQQYVSYMPGLGSASTSASGSNNAELSGQMYPAVTITVTKSLVKTQSM